METKIHVFEKVKLGIAPFKVVDYSHETYQSCPGAPIQVGAACNYCGTGIKDVFHIRSADGKTFKVGSTCVNKTGDKGLIDPVKKELYRLKVERSEKRCVDAFEKLEDVKAILISRSHPQAWATDLTLYDWAKWMISNAGLSGHLKVARVIEKALK